MKVYSANFEGRVSQESLDACPFAHESFLREIFYFHIFAKVLSLESFPLYGIYMYMYSWPASKPAVQRVRRSHFWRFIRINYTRLCVTAAESVSYGSREGPFHPAILLFFHPSIHPSFHSDHA